MRQPPLDTEKHHAFLPVPLAAPFAGVGEQNLVDATGGVIDDGINGAELDNEVQNTSSSSQIPAITNRFHYVFRV